MISRLQLLAHYWNGHQVKHPHTWLANRWLSIMSLDRSVGLASFSNDRCYLRRVKGPRFRARSTAARSNRVDAGNPTYGFPRCSWVPDSKQCTSNDRAVPA